MMGGRWSEREKQKTTNEIKVFIRVYKSKVIFRLGMVTYS